MLSLNEKQDNLTPNGLVSKPLHPIKYELEDVQTNYCECFWNVKYASFT